MFFIFELKVMLRKLKACMWFDRLPRGSMGTEFLNKCFGSRGSLNCLGAWIQMFQFSSEAQFLECHLASSSALIPAPSTVSYPVFTDLKESSVGAWPGDETPLESF